MKILTIIILSILSLFLAYFGVASFLNANYQISINNQNIVLFLNIVGVFSISLAIFIIISIFEAISNYMDAYYDRENKKSSNCN